MTMTELHTTRIARLSFEAAARACGSDPIVEESALLSIGREFLPAHVIAAGLDKTCEPTAEYWEWLQESVEMAQAEHDAEIAAGHETTD